VRGVKGAEVRIQKYGDRSGNERQEQEKYPASIGGPKRQKAQRQRQTDESGGIGQPEDLAIDSWSVPLHRSALRAARDCHQPLG
jgi:hypothetical protein